MSTYVVGWGPTDSERAWRQPILPIGQTFLRITSKHLEKVKKEM